MSLEHSPARNEGAASLGHNHPRADDYWNALVDEKVAAAFLGVVDRTMQTMRQRGDGPPYVVISARCIRYRRIGLKAWADARMRTSTADPGPETQPASRQAAL